jgi:hypothetical protein
MNYNNNVSCPHYFQTTLQMSLHARGNSILQVICGVLLHLIRFICDGINGSCQMVGGVMASRRGHLCFLFKIHTLKAYIPTSVRSHYCIQ